MWHRILKTSWLSKITYAEIGLIMTLEVVLSHLYPSPLISSQFLDSYHCLLSTPTAILQKYLDNYDLSIKVIYIVGTLAFAVGALPEPNTQTVWMFATIISSFWRSEVLLSTLRNCCHGHLPKCVCIHDHDRHLGHHLHEHVLLSLCITGAVLWNKRGMYTSSVSAHMSTYVQLTINLPEKYTQYNKLYCDYWLFICFFPSSVY